MKKHIVGYAVLGALAVGGTSATAATMITGRQVRDNSLTGRDIRDSSIIGRDVQNSSLTGGDIAPRSIDLTDLSPNAVSVGPPGLPGAPGEAGAPGATGIASIAPVEGTATPICAGNGGSCAVASSTATCPSGSRVVGGGFNATPIFTFIQFAKASTTTYAVIAVADGPNSGTIQAQAICANGPGVRSVSTQSAGAVADDVAEKLVDYRSQARAAAR